MLLSSVPQLRWHVARQALVTWLALAAMAAIFLLQPTIVRYTHDFLFGQGFVQSDYDQRVFAQYFSWRPLLIFRCTDTVFGTHSDIEDRAQALGLKPRVLVDGNVQVGEVVIAA